jgi:hypothetical protein
MRKPISGLLALAVVAALVLVTSPADAASRYVVTVSASTDKADVGQTFTLSGKVTPRARGEKVQVQRFTGGLWTTVAKARLNRHSRYTATVAVAAPGDNLYRVVKPRSDGHRKGISPTVAVVGWRWRPVNELRVVGDTSYTTVLPSGILGGQPYSPYIKQSGPSLTAQIVYALDGQCTRLDLHVGGTPDSPNTDPSYAYLDATYVPPSTGPANLFNGPVSKNSDPVHIVRGPDVVSSIATITLFASIGAINGVAWGAAKAYCRS